MKFTFWLPFLFLFLAPLADSVVTEKAGNLRFPIPLLTFVPVRDPAALAAVFADLVSNREVPNDLEAVATVPVLGTPASTVFTVAGELEDVATAPVPGSTAGTVVTEPADGSAPSMPKTSVPTLTEETDKLREEASLRERYLESLHSKEINRWKKVFEVALGKITRANKPEKQAQADMPPLDISPVIEYTPRIQVGRRQCKGKEVVGFETTDVVQDQSRCSKSCKIRTGRSPCPPGGEQLNRSGAPCGRPERVSLASTRG